jgi:hypothetical protein
MKNKSTLWLALYFLILGLITIGVYVGIHIFFKEPFVDPLFSSIKPLQNVLLTEAEKHSYVTQSRKEVRPTLPPLQTTERNKYFVIRKDDNPQFPTYIIRGHIFGPIVEVDKTIQGTCVLSADLPQTRFPFILRGNNGKYSVGVNKGGFSEYPNTLEIHTFSELKNIIPSGTFVQLEITTRDYSLKERDSLVAVLENSKVATNSGENPILKAFSVDIIRN